VCGVVCELSGLCGVVWCVWFEVVWCGLVRVALCLCGVVWCVWCGVWCGLLVCVCGVCEYGVCV
jgi:hypothetical protein